jgi:hypothetical protein
MYALYTSYDSNIRVLLSTPAGPCYISIVAQYYGVSAGHLARLRHGIDRLSYAAQGGGGLFLLQVVGLGTLCVA